MRFPESRRSRTAICLSLVVLVPLLTATLTICIVGALLRTGPARVTPAVLLPPYLAGAVLGAAGAAGAALALPIGYWGRITAAVVSLIGVFFAFPAFCFLANEAVRAVFGVGVGLGPLPS